MLLEGKVKHQDYQSTSYDAIVHTGNLSDNNRAPIKFPVNQPPDTNHYWGECRQNQAAQHHSCGPFTIDFEPAVETSTHHRVANDPRVNRFRWTHHLGHTSFAVLKLLAELDEIPDSLAKVTPPF